MTTSEKTNRNVEKEELSKLFSEFNITAERLEETYRLLQEKVESTYGFGAIVGKDKKMRDIYELIRAVAKTRAAVLLCGESGTGKELIARTIHQESDRKDGPFISVNCAALPEGLLESELFGHEKGAFTGAVGKVKGKFELAHQGTLLLDEISEMSLVLQAKLLRVLQDFKFFRIGGTSEVKVDVRIIATTNCELAPLIREGKFRSDLFYRLNVVSIKLPALRERKSDIPLLAAYFFKKYVAYYGKEISSIRNDAMRLLLNYDWPGNVRELENAIERAVVLNSASELKSSHFELLESVLVDERQAGVGNLVGMSLREIEKKVILATLGKVDGSRIRAAQILGISERTLREKLKQWKREESA